VARRDDKEEKKLNCLKHPAVEEKKGASARE